MKTLDELDRLHAAATAGEWADHADESVRWDDPMACGYDSRAHHRGPPYYCTGPRCATVEGAEADASAIVALHNAWPSFSARLRAAEAEVERLRGALSSAIEELDTIPEDPKRFARVAGMTIPLVRGGLSKALLPAEARAALGET